MAKTIFLSVWHNWAKGDKWASANNTNEATESNLIVNEIIRKGIPWVKLVKVPLWLTLPQRIKWINNRLSTFIEPFALEFHMDSWWAKAEGASVRYNDDNLYTQREGKQFLQKYTEITGLKSRHVNSDRTNRLKNLWFVSEVKCASLLIELGFISNPKELAIIRSKAIDWVIQWVINMNKL